MVAPATLTLRPCATLAPSHAGPLFPTRPPGVWANRRRRAVQIPLRKASIPSALVTRAVAVDSNQLGSSLAAQKEKSTKYYFVVANAKFMLDEEEHFKELLFERLQNYKERNKEQDFWLVIEPKFLDKFPQLTRRLKRPAVSLVSTNAVWITFMKLRLDRVLCESYEAATLEEALASNPADLDFEKPGNWVAPYPKYEYGWWEAFLPPCKHNA